MTTEQQKKYIKEQRAKGVSDDEILNSLNKLTAPAQERSLVGELLPTAFGIGGGIIGGIAGSVAPGPGTIAGGIAGAGAGAALGETIQQGIEKKYLGREKFNTPQIVATGIGNAAMQGIGGGIAKVGGSLLKVARPTLVKTIAKISDLSDDVVEKVLSRSSGVVTGVKEGEQALINLAKRSAEGFKNISAKAVAESKQKVAEFSKQSVYQALPGTKQALLDVGRKFTNNIATKLSKKYNIGITKTGNLLFDRARNVSNIVSPGDKKTIQEAFDTVQKIVKYPDIKNIDSILERLIILRSKTPAGTPTGAETRKIVAEMQDEVVAFVKSIPSTYGKGYANYAKYLDESLQRRVMLEDAREFFGFSGDIAGKELSKVVKRLQSLYNEGELATRQFAESAGKEISEDVGGTVAGYAVSAANKTKSALRGLPGRDKLSTILNFVPQVVLENFAKTGKMSPEWMQKTIKATGYTADAILKLLTNLGLNKTNK